jgi:alpha/beta superfamily hydrolase
VIALLLLLATGCGGSAPSSEVEPAATTTSAAVAADLASAQRRQGRTARSAEGDQQGVADGEGGGGGGKSMPLPEPDTKVKNPTSGADLAVYIDEPRGKGPFNAIVIVPGGTNPGGNQLPPQGLAQFVDRGYVVVRYDPDGRGNSGGTEDLGGPIHQDALKAVIAYTSALPQVVDDRVGVMSFSLGIATAAGAIAQGDSGAAWLMDWEGPSNRRWIANCSDATPEKEFRGHRCDEEAFWATREADKVVGKITVPYQRMQAARDHVHGAENGHAISMVEAANAGLSPWVRLNDLDPNLDNSGIESAVMPTCTNADREVWMADWAEDLFLVVDGKTPSRRVHVSTGGTAGGQGGQRGRGPQRPH